MIVSCWSQEIKDRPSFNDIVEELKTNDEFINYIDNPAEFYDYVDFIDNYQSTFNETKKIIHFTDFIKAQGRNKNVKPVMFNEKFIDEQNVKMTTNEIDKKKRNNK